MSRHRSEPPADWLPPSDQGGYAMPDYPPAPDHQPGPEHPEAPGGPGYPPADGSPAISHDEYGEDHEAYGMVAGHDGLDRHDLRPGADRHGLRPSEYGVVYNGYGVVPERAGDGLRQVREPGHTAPGAAGPDLAPLSDGDPASRSDAAARWAMLGYLTVPLFGFVVPLLVYLRTLHGSSWSRAHAAQALNVWITAVFYGLSALIMGTMLALDSPHIALIMFGSLVVALWLVMLAYLVRAATAASQGLPCTVPRWLCSRIVR
jgi:uncharacterized protein